MTTKSKAKPYTTVEVRKIKEMYESGSTYADIAQELNRSIFSVMATTSRMIKTGQIRMIRCPSIIGLGGLTAAKTALDQATPEQIAEIGASVNTRNTFGYDIEIVDPTATAAH